MTSPSSVPEDGKMPTLVSLMTFKCETCGGTERVYRDCWNCDGEGEVLATWDDSMGDEYHRCHHCGGRGGYFLCAKCAPPEVDPRDEDDDYRSFFQPLAR